MRITILAAPLPAPAAPASREPGVDRLGTEPAATAEVSLECHPGETVLSALSRQGVRVPSACQAGICRACLVRALHGDPGPDGSAGLEHALRADGYFLACQARPPGDLTMALAGGDIYTPARLLSVRREGPALRVRVRPERPLNFRPGQHVALRIPAHRDETPPTRPGPDRASQAGGLGRDLVRVYSLANGPDEADRDGAEFYVRVYPGGAMSTWLASARPGADLSLGRPSGTCCYQPGEPGAPLLLAGTGTGVAPLAAVARDALAHGHHGPIVLLRGAADPSGLYPDEHQPPEPVRLRTCVLSHGEDIVAATVAEYTALTARAAPGRLTGLPRGAGMTGVMSEVQVYLCGGAGVVARTRRALFLAGQSLRRIHCDEFSPAELGAPGQGGPPAAAAARPGGPSCRTGSA
jgi:CDP-4-dehydro-6-deoxyglucose reductase